jgi:ribosomal protection tetracycline resistance protein
MINVGMLAHVDAGKTTLTERILYLTGAVREVGAVDKGTAHTDSLEVERRRGISVKSAEAFVRYMGRNINIIDTPGHMDFTGEIQRALLALDYAVLIVSAVEGVQAQTGIIWKALRELNIPVIFFINKIDRMGADNRRVADEIREHLGAPLADWDETGISDAFLEALTDHDDWVMENYLEHGAGYFKDHQPRLDCLAKGLFHQLLVCPCVAGSALRNQGVETLLELLCWICGDASASGDPNGPFSAVVYKIEHHSAWGRLAGVRVFSGQTEIRGDVYNHTRKETDKITLIKKYNGVKLADAQRLLPGETGLAAGIQAGIGDILGQPHPSRKTVEMAVPLIQIRVSPRQGDDYMELIAATSELTAEDPLLHMVWASDERELIIHITGMIQLEVLQFIYENRFKLAVTFGRPTVIYKETPAAAGYGFVSYTMPKPCWAVMKLFIEPLPRGAGVEFISTVRAEKIAERYQQHIRQTLPTALKQGPKGWETTDLRLTLVDGEDHIFHTHPLDFIVATPMAVLGGLVNTDTVLLEPMLTFSLQTPTDLGGKIIGEILRMRGTYDSPVITDSGFHMEGRIPLAESMDFPQRLAAISGGRGIWAARFCGYEPCPPGLGETQRYRGVSPLDKAKYILHIRGAL